MDSADPAPPPKAPPLPSEATNATKATAICTKTVKPPVSPQELVTPNAPTTAAAVTKKRPLAIKAIASTSPTLVIPALKKETAPANKSAPVKAKKTLKKKKKKFSSILSGMMKPKKALDIQAERESLRKTLGGGDFCKVDKI